MSKIVDSGEWTGGILIDTEVKPLLTISGFRELEDQKPCSEIHENCEVQSPEGAKRFVWGQLLVKYVEIRHFDISEDRRLRLLSQDPRNHET